MPKKIQENKNPNPEATAFTLIIELGLVEDRSDPVVQKLLQELIKYTTYYTCEDCKMRSKDVMKKSSPFSWINHEDKTALCQKCAHKRIDTRASKQSDSYIILDSDTGGGLYSGYNVGLDADVRDRAHYKKLVKEKGVVEVG